MPLQVDNRAGSAPMEPMLRRLGLDTELTQMAFGDIAWQGWGANGDPVSIGMEIKTLDDCIACIQSGRFAGHQLPGLIQCYDHIYLMVQGQWKARQDGVLVQLRAGHGGSMFWGEAGGGQRRWMWRDFESWLTTMEIMGGIRVLKVMTWQEGAEIIKTKYNWFQREEHKSHQVVYSGKQLYSDQALLRKPSLARRIAKELPGVGLKRSEDVARRFHTVEAMSNATVAEWKTIPGFGPKLAQTVYKAIHQNGDGGK